MDAELMSTLFVTHGVLAMDSYTFGLDGQRH